MNKDDAWEKLTNFSDKFFKTTMINLLGYSAVNYFKEEGYVIIEIGDGTLIRCSIEDRIPMSKVLEKPVK